jgi:hypothetical protein
MRDDGTQKAVLLGVLPLLDPPLPRAGAGANLLGNGPWAEVPLLGSLLSDQEAYLDQASIGLC